MTFNLCALAKWDNSWYIPARVGKIGPRCVSYYLRKVFFGEGGRKVLKVGMRNMGSNTTSHAHRRGIMNSIGSRIQQEEGSSLGNTVAMLLRTELEG